MSTKKAYPTKYYIRFLTFLVFAVFTFFFRVKKKLPNEVKKLKPPFIILSNHVGFWDPFIVGHYLPHFTHFVSSDAVFKSRFLSFFLTRLGTIPKKKNVRDTKVIRDILAVINQGENVGLFPEAVRNWAGSSFVIDPSIIKLLKLLKVPVVIATLKGMNLFNPRWAKTLRPTQVEVEYKLLFEKNDISTLSENEMFEQLSKAIEFDEVKHQKKKMNKIYSQNRSEYINHALYACPECKNIDSFRTNKNNFTCSKCSYEIHINKYGFFERTIEGELHFDNIRDWYNWQEKWLLDLVKNKLNRKYSDVVFQDANSKIYHSKPEKSLKYIGSANVKLFIDRIELAFDNKESIIFNFNDLQTINPQVNERVEIFYNNEMYRLVGGRNGVSGLKWEVALNAIWKNMGQHYKLSPYILQE